MSPVSVQKDERTVFVENVSFRYAYYALSYGLLAIVVIRAAVWRESSWDLMALVVAGGVVALTHQVREQAVERRQYRRLAAAAVGAAATALALTLLRYWWTR